MTTLLIGVLPPWLAALVWLVIAAAGALLVALWRRVRAERTADDAQLAELLTMFHQRLTDVDDRLTDVEADRDIPGEDERP